MMLLIFFGAQYVSKNLSTLIFLQENSTRSASAKLVKDDESSDDEEIKDLLKNINLSGKKSVISNKLRSASPLSSNASEDDSKYETKK